MVTVNFSIGEDYWQNFELKDADIEFLYNYLLEKETPLTPQELTEVLVRERIRWERQVIEEQRSSGGDIYLPQSSFADEQWLVFPALNWQRGQVTGRRLGQNPDLGAFQVIEVALENGEKHEFASELEEHKLNDPVEIADENPWLDESYINEHYFDDLVEQVESDIEEHEDFVRIAGRWFPRALLVDVNVGHLNLAEAVLDMAGGGPLPTEELIEQIDLSSEVNPKLVEFSLDYALQQDPRFDEVGPAGDILWFLHRLEPEHVKEPPPFLRYSGIDYDRSLLDADMLALERKLDDELSPIARWSDGLEEVDVRLIFSHWRSGTLPLSARVRHLFPTAYEAPRIRFILVDGETGENFPGWVVREKRYVYGLKEWYDARELMPGSIVYVGRGDTPGEVRVRADSRRSAREWIRTVLVGSDGALVFAMLKQIVKAAFDERMAIAVPDPDPIDEIWKRMEKEKPPFERTVVNTMRELAKLNPQSHVHATELYAAVNVIRRTPPGPLLALLASRPWFMHVGDLHYRVNESERAG